MYVVVRVVPEVIQVEVTVRVVCSVVVYSVVVCLVVGYTTVVGCTIVVVVPLVDGWVG